MSTKSPTLDLVIPVFNEGTNIHYLLDEVKLKLAKAYSVSIIFVNDGSSDNTLEVIRNTIELYPELDISCYSLTRNYGKEIAVKCGIDQSCADFCVIMDGDLQHPPDYIIKAHKKLVDDQSNIVFITQKKRRDNLIKKIFTVGYKKIIDRLSKRKVYLTDFTFIDRKAVKLIQQFNESDFFTRGILSVIGLKSSEIQYSPAERKSGETKFSFSKLLNLAIESVLSVSVRPLRLAIYIGILISFLSICFGLILVVEKVMFGQQIEGFATLGFGMFFLGGIQLLFLGLIGEYVGKTYIQAKNRPTYTIDVVLKNHPDGTVNN